MKNTAIKNNENMRKYLRSTYFINWEEETVKNKAIELTSDIEDTSDKVQSNITKSVRLFNFVRDEIKYVADFRMSSYKRNRFRASVALRNGFGFCVPKAVLLAALSRAIGIPSRLHFKDIKNHLSSESFKKRLGGIFIYHGYVELFLGGKWIAATPAFDTDLCKHNGYPIVNFDGKNDGLLSKRDDSENLFIEYIKDRGIFRDVPFLKIMKTWAVEYGIKKRTRFD